MPRRTRETLASAITDSSEGTPKTWSPELIEALYALLYRADPGIDDLEARLAEFEEKHGDTVYSELLYLLSHLHFEPAEAKNHWREIVGHRNTMRTRLGTPVDLRVALVSYFVQVNRQLRNPKIIELKVFEQTQASAYRDELTDLYNYRYFREYLSREIRRSERYNPPLSLVMVDIDDFKSYNDRNGHEVGNRALATIAGLLTESLRKIDVPVRYGGEEFALILPSTSKTGAHQVAERTRTRIERHVFYNEDMQPGGALTVSMGVATFPADAKEAGELIRRADSAMYFAKNRGKNQVHLFGENRRSYKRIDASLNGKFCVVAAEYHSMTTVNISEGGLLFLVDFDLPVGSLIDVQLPLPGLGRVISTSGRVVRVEERPGGRYEAAIRIIEIATEDQGVLAKFIRQNKPSRKIPATVSPPRQPRQKKRKKKSKR